MSSLENLLNLLISALGEHEEHNGIALYDEHWSYNVRRIVYPGLEEKVEEISRDQASKNWEKLYGSDPDPAVTRSSFVEKYWREHAAAARDQVDDEFKQPITVEGVEHGLSRAGRIDILIQLIERINSDENSEVKLTDLYTMYLNLIYQSFSGTHEERLGKIVDLKIPPDAHEPKPPESPVEAVLKEIESELAAELRDKSVVSDPSDIQTKLDLIARIRNSLL
jgi:hypothetical protein